MLRPALDSAPMPAPVADAPRGDTSGTAIAAAVAATARAPQPAPEPEAPEAEHETPQIAEASPDAADNGDAGSGDVTEDLSSDDVLATSDPAVDPEEAFEDDVAEVVAEAAPVRAPVADPAGDSLAAKLQRIRAVVGSAQRPASVAEPDALTESFFDDSDTPDVADVTFEEAEEAAPAAPAEDFDTAYEDDGDLSADAEADAEVAEEPAVDAAEDDEDDFDAPDFDTDVEEEAEAPAAPGAAEDTAEDSGPSDMISRVLARHGKPAETPAEETAEETAEPEAAEEPVRTGPRVIRVRRPEPQPEAVAEDMDDDLDDLDTPAAPSVADLDGADELDSYLATDDDVISAEEEAEMLRAIDGDDLDDDLDDLDDDFDTDLDEDDFDDDLDDDQPEAEETAEPVAATQEDNEDDSDARAISNVLRLGQEARVATPEAAVAEDDAEEDAAAFDDQDDDQDEDEDTAEDTPAPRSGRGAFLASDIDDSDEDLNRLLEEANAQMEEPEGSRRRSAIAQLKAAVAATEAARRAGEPEDDAGAEQAENAFRNDLDEVVRPRRAERPVTARTERPRPAPLKLVASQRVDLPESRAEKPAMPVRPRRVERSAEADAGSFAQFAERMGANDLPALLEAAAAYTSFVEGAEEFSRPQIMRRVRAVQADDFNREDGLRTFADLIRKGRFTKVSHGRFQVAEDTPFHPERRAG